MSTIFILGAGASRECGGPLMLDFLDAAERVYNQRGGPDSPQFELVFKALDALQRVHAKSRLETQNVESVFAAFEMASLTGTLAGLTAQEIERLAPAMRTVIVRTLEESIKCPIRQDNYGQVQPPPPYEPFADLIGDIVKKSTEVVSVITFNYDLALDYALVYNGLPVDWCLDVIGEPKPRSRLAVMKLHGSLNWARCEVCQDVTRVSPEFGHLRRALPGFPGQYVQLEIMSQFRNRTCTKCNKPITTPMIVPPTWNKTQYHEQIDNVWKTAAKHLSGATNIFVIGYSLPPADYFFRNLYALGSVGPTRIQRFWVFDPDPDGSVGERFRSLLGPDATTRFQLLQKRFTEAIAEIREALRVQRSE